MKDSENNTRTTGGNNDKTHGEQQKGSTSHLLDRYSNLKSANASGDSSPYYKSKAPTIELPKGGGAIKGIDEKFTVNAVNGTTSLEIPLPVTPGRGEFTPKLSIQYNSGGGNSEFGQGWSLNLPSIQRKTDKKLPEYRDDTDSDVFLLAGAEDLVPQYVGEALDIIYPQKENSSPSPNTVYTVKRYQPRIEGLFARIEFITEQGSAGSWWRVTTKDNIVTYYGLTDNGRIADPDNTDRIFKWLPQFSYDRKGNIQVYTYAAENTDNIPLAAHEVKRKSGVTLFANTYLKRVLYCNTTPFALPNTYDVYRPDVPVAEDFLMELVLDYGEHDTVFPKTDDDQFNQWHCRKDPFSDFHAGFEMRTYRRCYRALMYHKFSQLLGTSGEDAVLVKSLNLEYSNGNTNAGDDEFTESDFISSCTLKGYKLIEGSPNSYVSKALPAITYDYQPLIWNNTIQNVSKKDAENIPQGLTGNYLWTDFEGEGLPGVLSEQGRAWFYKHNLGDGKFAPHIQIAEKPSFTGLGEQLQWQDLDADGRRHLVSNNAMYPGYFELDDDQEWQTFRTFKGRVNIDWQSPYTKLLDLDGDGRPDVLITEDRVWRWYKNKGTEGYTIGGEVSKTHNEEQGPQLLMNDKVQSIFLADINGDGLTDIVRIQNGEVCYWPNKGYGAFGNKVVMSNAPIFDRPEMYNPVYLTLNDISGTGAVDIIYLGQDKCTAWINYSGNAWSNPITIGPLPGIEQYSKIAVMDFLGSGTSSIVWSSPLPQHAHAPLRYIDLMGGNKPFLMKSYSNGMGKTTSFTYKHSTKYYIEDKLGGTPWATKLPFPVHCIEKVTTLDTVSETSYTQTYSYHHGYYDHEEREFRGFGRVDITDTEKADAFIGVIETDMEQDPVLTKTWYHTGAWLRESTLISKYEEEYYNVANWNLPGLASYTTGLNIQELREAHRALKGKPLRQEVYALDGSARQYKPYTVTAYSYIVKCLQELKDNRYASFLSHEQEKVVWHCERNISDARVLHELILNVDDFGNVTESARIAYKRAVLPTVIPGYKEQYDTFINEENEEEAEKLLLAHTSALTASQGTTLVSYTQNSYTNDIIDTRGGSDPATTLIDNYRLRVLCDEKTFELHNLTHPVSGLWQPAALRAAYTAITSGDEIEFSQTAAGTQKRLLSHKRIVYLKDDTTTYETLATQGSKGLVYQQYQLVMTQHMMTDSANYDHKVDGDLLDSYSAYLQESSITEFGSEAVSETNYWLPSGTMSYDTPVADTFYTPIIYTDPWGNDTTIDYGANYYLLPETITDALGNIMTVNYYDWRCMQPQTITDMNDNVNEIFYDALCMPVAVAMKGKVSGSFEADELGSLNPDTDTTTQNAFWTDPKSNAAALLGHATWRCVYDLNTLPVAVAMIAREEHYQDNASSPLQIRVTYTDGLGRVAMHKVQTTDYPGTTDERWIASGKTIYNNKGKTVMQYEPYYVDSFAYDDAEVAAAGVSPRMYYDPLGRLRRTDLPDGSYTKTEWDAWYQKTFDNNDTVIGTVWETAMTTAGGNYADAATKAARHDNTPTTVLLDVLAQPFYTIQHDRYDVSGTQTDFYYQSYVSLDVLGNRLEVCDARMGSTTPVLQYKYNMLKAVIKQDSADSGTQYLLNDVDNQSLYAWDADDRQFYFEYDELRRLIQKSVDDSGVEVLEMLEYGEELLDPGTYDPKIDNLRGQLYNHYDGAGLMCVKHYDFKGNPTITWRTFTTNYDAHPNWAVTTYLEGTDYVTESSFDALSRPVTITTPDTGVTTYVYEETGLLYSIDVEDVHGLTDDIINSITYNAKGQRTKAVFDNGATTFYEYDENTFRIKHIRTSTTSDTVFLQKLTYFYDPVGNITYVKDEAHQAVYFNNSFVSADNDYTYDALYRVIKAKGREHTGINNDPVDYNDASRIGHTQPQASGDQALENYIQYYTYDEVGNMTQMKHTAGLTPFTTYWTKNFTISGGNNKLTASSIGSNGTGTESYDYDARGNMTGGLNHLTNGTNNIGTMVYNAENRLEKVVMTADRTAYYQYDGNGQRVRKVIKTTSTGALNTRKYVGGWEEYIEYNGSSNTLKRETLHIMDDSTRVAMVDTELNPGTNAYISRVVRYQYSNHLGTAALEVDASGNIISYEEYYAFGNTSFQTRNSTISQKRYKYTGKERDETTGLYYHGARFYAPWLCRWCAADPINSEHYNQVKGNPDKNVKRNYIELTASSYEYSYANPIIFSDISGEQPDPEVIDKVQKEVLRKGAQQAGKELSETTVQQGGKIVVGEAAEKGMLSFLSKAGGLFIGFMLSGPEAGGGSTIDAQREGSQKIGEQIRYHKLSKDPNAFSKPTGSPLLETEPITAPEPLPLPGNPTNDFEKQTKDHAAVRFQVQQGTELHVADNVQINTMEVGVTKLQGTTALGIIYAEAIQKDKSLGKNPEFIKALQKVDKKIQSIQGGMYPDPSKTTNLQQKFIHNKKQYRIDVEIKRGLNFKN